MTRSPMLGLIGAPIAAPDAEVIDGRFSVAVVGDGPDVVLIPGLTASRDAFSHLVEALKDRWRFHLVQIAGMAGEPAAENARGRVVGPTVEALYRYIRDRMPEPPAVIGHSLGGAAGLMLAARHPASVSKLMVVDALPFFSLLINPFATKDSIRPEADAFRDELLSESAEDYAADQPAAVAKLIADEEDRARAVGWSIASDRSVVARAGREVMLTDLRPELAKIRAPLTVLYAWHSSSWVAPFMVDAFWARAYAGPPPEKLIRIDGSRHYIMFDQPERFEQEVETFLNSSQADG